MDAVRARAVDRSQCLVLEDMDLLTSVLTGDLLALFTGVQAWINKGRFDSFDRRFERLESDIAQLRSDLLHVVLSLTPRQQTG